MSQNYGQSPSYDTTGAAAPSGAMETAKQEATEVTSTAQTEAGRVLDTAKQEASTVAGEAKSQAKRLYSQTRQELAEQAATQQQRVADGLRSIGDEFASLAQGSENPGVATDLVRQASTRLTDASSWLSQRDPGSLLDEVKSFARRRPGVFIAGALVAGVVAGRLTRALGENAKEEHDASGSSTDAGAAMTRPTSAAPTAASATGMSGSTGAAVVGTADYPAGEPYSEGTGAS